MFVGLRNLCEPAFIYLLISLSAVFLIGLQTFTNQDSGMYCVGMQKCKVSSVVLMFFIKLLYIAFWTWVLNIICAKGYTTLAWILVILPILIMFILISMVFLFGLQWSNIFPNISTWTFF